MSNPHIVTLILFAVGLICLAWSVFVNWSQSVKIESLRAGQARWRDIAISHQKRALEFESICKLSDSSLADYKPILATWEERFRILVVSIWGEPPINRNMQDVLDYISMLKTELMGHKQSAERLMVLVCRHNQEIQRAREELSLAKASLSELQVELGKRNATIEDDTAFFAALINNGWVVVRGKDKEFHVAADVRGVVLAVASTPEEAVNQALESKGMERINFRS